MSTSKLPDGSPQGCAVTCGGVVESGWCVLKRVGECLGQCKNTKGWRSDLPNIRKVRRQTMRCECRRQKRDSWNEFRQHDKKNAPPPKKQLGNPSSAKSKYEVRCETRSTVVISQVCASWNEEQLASATNSHYGDAWATRRTSGNMRAGCLKGRKWQHRS